MNDFNTSENNLLYSDSSVSVTLDSDFIPQQKSVLDSEDPVESSEEGSEEERGSEVEGTRSGVSEFSSEYQGLDYSERLDHIDTTINNIYGLVIVSLVLVGCGLVLKFIRGLLNK